MRRNGSKCTLLSSRALDLRNSGLSYKKIADIINCSVNMAKNALHYVQRPERRGNPRKTSKTTDRKIVTTSKKDLLSSSKDIVKASNLILFLARFEKYLLKIIYTVVLLERLKSM